MRSAIYSSTAIADSAIGISRALPGGIFASLRRPPRRSKTKTSNEYDKIKIGHANWSMSCCTSRDKMKGYKSNSIIPMIASGKSMYERYFPFFVDQTNSRRLRVQAINPCRQRIR
ncbi:hypothetical protein D3C86_1776440 [compost metagenome]